MVSLRRTGLLCLPLAIMTAVGSAAVDCTAQGKEPKPKTPSVRLAPADAAFYLALLRNREQIEAIANSRAWARFKSVPLVQMGWNLYLMQAAVPNSLPARIQNALRDPDARKTIDFLGDLVSDEVFLFGASDVVDVMHLAQELSQTAQYAPALLELSEEAEPGDMQKIRLGLLLGSLAKDPERVKVPNLVVGFRVSDRARAKDQLGQVEQMLKQALESLPQGKECLKKTKLGRYEYLTLQMDGKMIPWKKLPLAEMRKLCSKPADLDALVARLKKLSLVVALGLRDDHVILCLGPNTELLSKLGEGPSLADADSLKPLAKLGDERIVSISYAGAEVARWASGGYDVEDLRTTAEGLLEQAELTAKEKRKIRKDVEQLAKDLRTLIPQQGAATEIGLLTPQGYEVYRYDWNGSSLWDGSAPLTLLEHVGGKPLCALAGREKISIADYEKLAKWAPVLMGYLEKYGPAGLEEDEGEKLLKFVKQIRPLGKRFDAANRNLLNALNGEMAFALDGQLRSKRVFKALPASDEPLPVLEPALIFGVRDASLLTKAAQEYQAMAGQLLKIVHDVDPDLPELKLPKPKASKAEDGRILSYAFPRDWGLDKKIALTAGLSETVAVVTISKPHAERLLAATPLKVETPLPDKAPQAGAFYLDWAGMLETLRPWAELAVNKMAGDLADESEAGSRRSKSTMKQVDDFISVLSVVRSVSSASYFEGKTLVTHSKVRLQDIAP